MHWPRMIVLFALLGALSSVPHVLAADAAAPAPKIELSADSAKRSIDAYLELREKYGRKVPTAARAITIEDTVSDGDGVRAIVTGKGFANLAEWQVTITSVAQTFAVLHSDGGSFDAKVAEIKANKDIPPDLRERMIAILTASQPSPHNLQVVKELAADPSYGPKLEQIARKKPAVK